MVAPSMPDAEKVAAAREALPAVGAGIYLNPAVAGPLPSESAAAMAEIAEWELRTGRAHRDRTDDVAARIDEARAAAAAILTADLDDVVVAHGLEDALARALRTVDWRAGDQVAVVADPSTAAVDENASSGVRVVTFDDPETALDTPGPRLLVLPLVRATNGARLPVEAIAQRAHARGLTVLVEASLAVGAVPVDRRALGADLLVARSEAWLLGPEGLAIVAGPGLRQPVGGFPLPSIAGFARGCGWLSMYVGLPWIHARGAALTEGAARRLGAIPGVRILTPEARATTLAFAIDGWPADTALDELGSRVFLLAAAVRELDAIRIGLGFWNTEAEIDRLADAVAVLAGSTRETLPPHPRLAMLGHDG